MMGVILSLRRIWRGAHIQARGSRGQYARDPSGLKSLRMTPEEGGSINGISTIYDIT